VLFQLGDHPQSELRPAALKMSNQMKHPPILPLIDGDSPRHIVSVNAGVNASSADHIPKVVLVHPNASLTPRSR